MDYKKTPSKLLWVDLEMTGLDPQKDKILEVAAIVTDWDFKELETMESGVGQNPQEVQQLLEANPFFAQFPQNKQQLLELTLKSPAAEAVEAQLVELIDRHFTATEPVLLAGNSIHMDRQFIRQAWPTIEARLHYRMLDVSAWKVVMQGKFAQAFDKTETHRAVQDIRESIAELKFYLQWFGQSSSID